LLARETVLLLTTVAIESGRFSVAASSPSAVKNGSPQPLTLKCS
jgi:hypothetical protein